MTTELKDLLERAADQVGERDFVDDAWTGAAAARRRSRVLGAVALAAAAAVVVSTIVVQGRPDGDGALPASTPRVSSSQPWRQASADVLGAATTYGPTTAQVQSLPRVDDRTAKTLGLPANLNPASGDIRRLSVEQPALAASGENAAPVTAIVLRRGASGSVLPVLYRPSLSRPWLVADAVSLAPVTDIEGNTSDPLGDRAISQDGRRVAFAQANKVVVLDVVTAQVRTIDVADPYLEDVGWLDDGSTLVARSAGTSWRVDPGSSAVTQYGNPAYPGRHQVVVWGDEVQLLAQGSAGVLSEPVTLPPLLSQTWGETFTEPGTGSDDKVAVGGYLSSKAAGAAPTFEGAVPYQGVLVVDPPAQKASRLLLVPDSLEGTFSKGCCRVLRWVDAGRLLIQWGPDVLLWDTRSQDLVRVSVVPLAPGTETSAPGTLTGSYSVAP